MLSRALFRKRLLNIFTSVSLGALCVADAAAGDISLTRLSTVKSGGFGEGAAEIAAFDPASARMFVTNAESNTIDILSISDPAMPEAIRSIDCSPFGGGVNSVAVNRGLVAAAIEAEVKQDPGKVVFFDIDGNALGQVTAGALPDMVTFTADGRYVLAANEGEPDDTYTVDPEGSVTIIDLHRGLRNACVKQVTFRAFNKMENWLVRRGVRIYGPKATVAQDLEPEYIAVGPCGRLAYVTLQENNAVAEIDIINGRCLRIIPLGFKDHSVAGNGFDASDKDGAIAIKTWPVFGMYLPDAIAMYNSRGLRYLVTVNEGDARDYDGYSEEARIKDLPLDPAVFRNQAELKDNKNLGRLKTTVALPQTNALGEYTKLYAYGGRSFSIFHPVFGKIYDSGDEFERITAGVYPNDFNSSNEKNGSFDDRSDDKGPEPEALAIGTIRGKTYAFIGLERIGGIMVYDITCPYNVKFVTYVNHRDFGADVKSATAGDLGVEGLVFVDEKESPVKKPLLIASNEVSGTVTVFQVSSLTYPDSAGTTPAPLLEHNGVTVYNGGYGSSMAPHPFLDEYFYLMTDRGPNVDGVKEGGNAVKVFPAPSFVPQIGLFRLDGASLVKVSTIAIKDRTGKGISGLPNPEGMGATGEIAKDLDGNYLGTDPEGLDPEGLVAAADGSFWISDEYGPHILHIDATGKTIERINPFGTGTGGRTLPAVLKRRRENRGMEGLTMTPGGMVVGIMQSALLNPNSSTKNSNVTRILAFNPSDGSSKQYLYLQDAGGLSNSEIASVSETEFVVLERDGGFPGADAVYKRFYRISLEGATDVSDAANSEAGMPVNGKTLEQCTADDLAGAGIVPAAKTLVTDLLKDAPVYPHDKPEGFAPALRKGKLAVINDDDFGILGDGAGGIVPKILPMTGAIDRNVLYFIDLPHSSACPMPKCPGKTCRLPCGQRCGR